MEKLYRYLRAFMDPNSEVAQNRFIGLRSFFNWAVKEGILPERRKLRILDLCAGTGIAGSALLETLREWGYEVSLTVVDKRKDDLLLVDKWTDGEVYGAVMDCLDDLRKLGRFDVALIFGYTMPHFDPFQTAELFKNVARVLEGDGVFLLEETDRFGAFFYRRAYREFVPEVRGKDYTIVSLDEGYNPLRGVIRRGYYKLPGWEKVGEIETRYWDLAGLAGIGKALFEEVRIIMKREHGVVNVGDIIYLRKG
ncbi:class I SAM-dependent methyltransferase [Thermococcus sp.]